ncbi:MAG: phosphate signaling complex protein PhoU [Verrucomicrobiales bacterium]|nr:phosphate signaling complex protein PhoU [Verrucomicrobiales bacterium]|tara:strand:+ start:57 stop:752 length:696 start_codon:yes stop_codon:yes gene_type:complete
MNKDNDHILGSFQTALDELNVSLFQMADLVRLNLDKAVEGLIKRDTNLCTAVIADDEDINNLEKRIDEEGLRIITLYQPVASDLRLVASMMKVSPNLERIGDQSVGIAKRARKMNKNEEISETLLVDPLYKMAADLLRQSLEAFKNRNVEQAISVKKQDAELNVIHKELVKKLTKRMESDPERIKDYLDLQFIARALERVGDYSKNICEDAIFVESAVDIRHGGVLSHEDN